MGVGKELGAQGLCKLSREAQLSPSLGPGWLKWFLGEAWTIAQSGLDGGTQSECLFQLKAGLE